MEWSTLIQGWLAQLKNMTVPFSTNWAQCILAILNPIFAMQESATRGSILSPPPWNFGKVINIIEMKPMWYVHRNSGDVAKIERLVQVVRGRTGDKEHFFYCYGKWDKFVVQCVSALRYLGKWSSLMKMNHKTIESYFLAVSWLMGPWSMYFDFVLRS